MYKLIILDIDGVVINLSRVANGGSEIFGWIPGLKGIAMEVFEWAEILSGVRYRMNDETREICRNRRNFDIGIMTIRSFRGLTTALQGNLDILERMSFAQVRKSMFGNRNRLRYGMKLWETPFVKPDERAFYKIAEFAERKNILPNEVLMVDDNPKNRSVAENCFGFMASPICP